MMLKLIAFPASFEEPSASPFCVKAMCLLEMSGQTWSAKFTSDPRRAPNGKLPVLDHDGQLIADSDAIRTHLENTFEFDFDAPLDSQQSAISRAIIRMVEEHLYFVMICDRWLNEENWAQYKKVFFGHMPFLLNFIVPKLARKQAIAQVMGQGIGRRSPAARAASAEADVLVLQALLGDKAFLFGDTPSAADATVIPMLRAISAVPVPTATSELVNGLDAIKNYLERGRSAIYPKSPAG